MKSKNVIILAAVAFGSLVTSAYNYVTNLKKENEELQSEISLLEAEKVYISQMREDGERERDAVIEQLKGENEQLKIENEQLKKA